MDEAKIEQLGLGEVIWLYDPLDEGGPFPDLYSAGKLGGKPITNGVKKSSWAVFACIVELLRATNAYLVQKTALLLGISIYAYHLLMPIKPWWHEGSDLINLHLPVLCCDLNATPGWFIFLKAANPSLYKYIKIICPGFSMIINVHIYLQETVCLSVDLTCVCLPVHLTRCHDNS